MKRGKALTQDQSFIVCTWIYAIVADIRLVTRNARISATLNTETFIRLVQLLRRILVDIYTY